MLAWFTTRKDRIRRSRELYGAIVTQARNPALYSDFGVPDTAEGRYEMVALHLLLALDRLGKSDVADEDLRRQTLETFVTDMDDAMREFGLGDTGVVKKVKRAAGGVYARGVDFRAALAQTGNAELESRLREHVYQGADAPAAGRLAAYVRRAVAHLDALPGEAVRAGQISFPSPEVA
jgi:cytochrome b pre-mRNA-processing protein 3